MSGKKRPVNRVTKHKPGTYKEFTKSLNQIFKSEPDDIYNNAAKKLNHFCENHVPKGKDGSVQWVLPLDTDIPNHAVVLLAHSVRPIRCIGEITKNEQCSKAIPLKYRYIVEKLVKRDVFKDEHCGETMNIDMSRENDANDDIELASTRENKRNSKKRTLTKKRKVDTVMVECGKKQQQLISRKKGFWVIWKPSLQANITTGQSLKNNMSTVLEWYGRFVEGMEKDPSPSYPRNHEHIFFEQFLLSDYPTPEWQKHTQEYQKTNKNHKEGLVASSSSSDMLVPPPPPPLDGEAIACSSCCSNDDDDREELTKKQRKKQKRGGGERTEKKRKLNYEQPCEIESSARELEMFDVDAFSKFMEQSRDPVLNTTSDSFEFGNIGDIKELGDLDDLVSV